MSTLSQALAAPLTAVLVAANSLIFLRMWNARAGYAHVSISYRSVVLERQWYRVVSSAFCHLNFMHLLMNMYGLWSFGALEEAFGSLWYLETTCLLLAACTACWLGGLHLLVARGGRAALADSSAVGYSGVLFGWMTLSMLRAPSMTLALPGGAALPVAVMPFAYLVLTKIVVPQSSFSGHLAGIAAGYIIGWADLMGGLRGYWLWTSLGYAAALVLLSLSANAALPPWVARFVQVSPEFLALTPQDALVGAAGAPAARGGGGAAAAAAGLPVAPPRMHVSNGVLSAWRPLDRDQIVVPVAPASASASVSSAASPVAAAPQPSLLALLFGGGANAARLQLQQQQEQQQRGQQRGLLGARGGPATASTEAAAAAAAAAAAPAQAHAASRGEGADAPRI